MDWVLKWDYDIDSGAFGTVSRYHQESDNKLVVLKKNKNFTITKQEADINLLLGNLPYFPKYYGFYDSCLVFDYVSGVTIYQHIKHQFKWFSDELIPMATQIYTGLAELNKRNITHNDISANNIMISRDKDLKFFIIDFGLADLGVQKRKVCGTIYYKPKEAVNWFNDKKDIDFKDSVDIDVRSAAYTLLEFYFGRTFKFVKKVKKRNYMFLDEKHNNLLKLIDEKIIKLEFLWTKLGYIKYQEEFVFLDALRKILLSLDLLTPEKASEFFKKDKAG